MHINVNLFQIHINDSDLVNNQLSQQERAICQFLVIIISYSRNNEIASLPTLGFDPLLAERNYINNEPSQHDLVSK